MTSLRTTAQSFDLFDTLIARACITPANLFAEVGLALNMPSFGAARMAAEQRVCSTSDTFDLSTIYAELCRSDYCAAPVARRLMLAEIEAEFDNAIPIAENLACVRDFDLVVSDMYLPASTLRGLLQHVGLRRFVHLFASNAGKYQGTIWPELIKRWLILRHVGDHPHADIAQPQTFGIATSHFTGASPTETEQYLHDAGLPLISRISRRLRLANPYVPRTVEAELWNHFVEFNVPLLCLSVNAARKQRDVNGRNRILFLARDCHFLSEVFLALYPDEPFELMHVSRRALATNPDAFANYFEEFGLGEALICDLVSTGLSWLRFSQSTTQSIIFFSMVYIDDYQYEIFDPAELDRTVNFRFLYETRSSEVEKWSMAIEIMNTAPHGSTVGLDRVGQAFVPLFEARHELPSDMLRALILAQAASIKCLRSQAGALAQELASATNQRAILSTMVKSLSGTDWLNRFASSAICQPMT